MEEAKHTELPWKISEGGDENHVMNHEGYAVADACDWGSQFLQRFANAKFIVRACNAYYKQLEANALALVALRGADAVDLDQRIQFNKAKKALEEAIAEAEGR